MPKIQITIARHERATNPDPLVFEINGEDFTCQEEMSEFVLMELAAAGAKTADEAEAGAAFINFLTDVLEPESYERFRVRAIESKWTAEEMLPFVRAAVEQIGARPTMPPSTSQDGEPTTGTQSRVISLEEPANANEMAAN